MDKTIATETDVQPIAAEEKIEVETEEARYQALEIEKDNYRQAYLKEVEKNKNAKNEGIEIDEDEKMYRVAQRALSESRLAEIAREQDTIIKKALKENKELKLAQLNKKEPSAGMGTHSEGTAVKDTLVTPEQMAVFKAKGWDDKKIERYKQNLVRQAK